MKEKLKSFFRIIALLIGLAVIFGMVVLQILASFGFRFVIPL